MAALVGQGDAEFAKGYWSGWKNAAGFYQQALGSAENRRIRRQLVYSCALRFVREFELDHVDPALLAEMPFLTRPLVQIGSICLRWEDEEAALASYRAALEIEPLLPTALFGQAVCLISLGRLDEADAVLATMLGKQTFYHGEANYYLARNQYQRGRQDPSGDVAPRD
ncbi:MAG TPA: hypothetical protein PKK12_13565 [Candidatus Aminicenantes bacterium]|nr:hypothetical protein [Candidatus Aminicenantes bacterium]